MVFVILLYIEIDRAIALVGITVVENLLHQLLLLDDMTRGMRLNAWRKYIECLHRIVIAVGVVLGYLHWLQLLQSCLLLYLVVALIGIVLQVSHIGNVAHIAHLVSQMLEITKKNIESNGRTRMTKMRVAIHSGATNIHAYIGGMKRCKSLLCAGEGVIDQ